MRSRRGATGLAGVVVIDKPAGPTSHDVVNAFRRATGEHRIGHAGTLDPMATGLLLVLVGRATRLEPYLMGHDKGYDATIVFGAETDTLDAEGEIVRTAAVPPALADAEQATALLTHFVGPQLQDPPAYSAIKRNGVPAHRRARAGETPVLEPRPIVVYEASLGSIERHGAVWNVSFAVSKGTYIRSLARDIGEAAGTVAHLGALRRTRIGGIGLQDAQPLEAAIAAAEAGNLPQCMHDPVDLLGLPVVVAGPDEVRDGAAVIAPDAAVDEGALASLASADEFFGVYRRTGDRFVPVSVMTPGVTR